MSLVTQEDEPVAVVQSYCTVRYDCSIVYRWVLATCDVLKIAKASKTYGLGPISFWIP